MPELPRLVLASGSPRRREILARHGLSFEVIEPNFNELQLDTSLWPEQYARRAAEEKASAGCALCPYQDAVVLGFDTIVAVDSKILGKPSDKAAARAMLEALSGQTHQVTTAIAVWRLQNRHARGLLLEHETTFVRFKRLDAASIEAYLESGEWRDKAGAYGIQGQGRSLIEEFRGDYENVIGLPFGLLVRMLPKAGFDYSKK